MWTIIVRDPFNDVEADIILRTSDNVEFRVFRVILTLSSPFFQGMLALPQPSDASASGNNDEARGSAASKLLSVDVSEDSLTLDTLLRFLYPNTKASFQDLAHALRVALAASKYGMSTVLDEIGDKVETEFVESNPLHVYLVACRMGWESVAKTAAEHCLNAQLTMLLNELTSDVTQSGVFEFPGAVGAICRLEEYRKDVFGKALKAINDQLGPYDATLRGCGDKTKDISGKCWDDWEKELVSNVVDAFTPFPRKEILDVLDVVPEMKCSGCNIKAVSDVLRAWLKVAADVLDDVLPKVELRFVPNPLDLGLNEEHGRPGL